MRSRKFSMYSDDELEHVAEVQVTTVHRLKLPQLKELLPYSNQNCTNKRANLCGDDVSDTLDYSDPSCGYSRVIEENELILGDLVRHEGDHKSVAYTRAGPREKLFFNPKKVRAGIVTCGGLCPGLNNVIRELVRVLFCMYDADAVFGFQGGFGGIYEMEPLELTTATVADINSKGGTILSSARGGFDSDKILDALKLHGVNQLYVIGGDGTQRGAFALYQASQAKAKDIGYAISIIGIPKTIDNDVAIIDKSFGFNTAVSEACKAIASAKTEAQCVPNGIGVVKLMGRHAGFIATHACLASGTCDLCLIPEVPIDGPAVMKHLESVIARQGHAVIIVAEGAGEALVGKSAEVDKGGNRKLPPIGLFLQKQITKYFAELESPIEVVVKYIDPSYMVRSVPANALDSLMCLLLSQNAVHGAMAGFTGFCVGLCNNRTVYLPMSAICRGSPRQVNPHGRMYERVLSLTGQPRVPLPELPENSFVTKRVLL